MAKQTIEIDVPEGCEVDYLIPLWSYRETQDVRLFFKKKEPEYIEVREYLFTNWDGIARHNSAQKGHSDLLAIEHSTDFIRWIDKDWRKVEI